MADLTYREINDTVFDALGPPRLGYYLVLLLLLGGVGLWFGAWMYQIKVGMGAAGISHPVGWAVYITNFVFWVGIAHSGTLISAILYLVRARFRNAISRSSEAMTLIAIAIAGMFPLVHLGRFWVLYFILPYPSERQLWPNFISPLLWDVMAITTYFTVSAIFFSVGLLPDLAAGREHFTRAKGRESARANFFRALSLGWSGAADQWRHYSRAYLFFAALATPLVVSVHSIVSWDFAMSLLPGWHSTIFPPYFVAGAIHSGLAMVLVLLIPMRRILKLERLITPLHLERVAQTLLVTTAIMGYSYAVEPFMAWYSGDPVEQQLEVWRATGWMAWAFWSIIVLNVLVPLTLAFKKLRTNLTWLFIIGLCVVAGMWIERIMIIVSSLAHDFLPHNWGTYFPRPVEFLITFGSFCLFFFAFLVFAKSLPPIPISDTKARCEDCGNPPEPPPTRRAHPVRSGEHAVLAVYRSSQSLVNAATEAVRRGFLALEAFSPVEIPALLKALGYSQSPVRIWTLSGAVFGAAFGYGLALFSGLRNALLVGGKHPTAWIPYTIIAFEMTILFGALANLAGLIIHTRLLRRTPRYGYDPRFAQDRFGLLVACDPTQADMVRGFLSEFEMEEARILDERGGV